MIQWSPELVLTVRKVIVKDNPELRWPSGAFRLLRREEYPGTLETLYLDVIRYIGVECDALTPQAIADLCAACYVPFTEG